MGIQIRKFVPRNKPISEPVLQYRASHTTLSTSGVIGLPVTTWGEWENVPIVLEVEELAAAQSQENHREK